jgi:hypothetical protein
MTVWGHTFLTTCFFCRFLGWILQIVFLIFNQDRQAYVFRQNFRMTYVKFLTNDSQRFTFEVQRELATKIGHGPRNHFLLTLLTIAVHLPHLNWFFGDVWVCSEYSK